MRKTLTTLLLITLSIAIFCTSQDDLISVKERSYSSDASLSSLTFSAGNMLPSFISNTTSYDIHTKSTTNSITITANLSNTDASMKINGVELPFGSNTYTINLNYGSNAVNIVVLSGNEDVQKVYSLNIKRYHYYVLYNVGSATGAPGAPLGLCTNVTNKPTGIPHPHFTLFASFSIKNLKDIVSESKSVGSLNGTQIASSYLNLMNSDLQSSLFNAGVLPNASDQWWSGSDDSGTYASNNCNNWNDNTTSYNSNFGVANSTDSSSWIENGNDTCDQSKYYLCLAYSLP